MREKRKPFRNIKENKNHCAFCGKVVCMKKPFSELLKCYVCRFEGPYIPFLEPPENFFFGLTHLASAVWL